MCDFRYDEWNPWTNKSRDIRFNSSQNSVGNGEEKLGKEFDVAPLGQNFSYDLDVNGEKWEVKELDSDKSFRLGVEVSSDYTHIISAVIRIFEKIDYIYNSLIEGTIKQEILSIKNSLSCTYGRSTTLLLDGLRKNEVSESNLEKANEIIETLKKLSINNKKTVQLYHSRTGSLQYYCITKAYDKLLAEDIPYIEISKIHGTPDDFNIHLIKKEIDIDLKNFDKYSLKERLNKIVRDVFLHYIKLVLVHEEYGFKPLRDLSKIYCNRITSGKPRCKIIE